MRKTGKGLASGTEGDYLRGVIAPVARFRTSWRFAAALAGVAGATLWFDPVAARAAAAASELDELRRLAAEAGIALDLPAWEFGGGIETGAGYSDNVLLTAFAPEASGFVRTTIDAMAVRLPQDDGVEWFNYADVTHTHWFSADTSDAWLALARTEWRWRPRTTWRFSAAGQVLYQDEVIDFSSLETLPDEPRSARVRIAAFQLEPTARWTFVRDWTAVGQLSASLEDFRLTRGDTRELEPVLALERDLGRAGTIAATAGRLARHHRDRLTASVSGREEIELGVKLNVVQTRGELRYELSGGAATAWRVRVRTSYLDNDDNGSGWYDYVRRGTHWSGSLERGAWRFDGDAGWRRYHYRVQTVGFGQNPPRRARNEWSMFARLERDLGETLAAFLELEHQRSRSNDPSLDYDYTVGVLGLRWSR